MKYVSFGIMLCVSLIVKAQHGNQKAHINHTAIFLIDVAK
jgi:hypothetical protein